MLRAPVEEGCSVIRGGASDGVLAIVGAGGGGGGVVGCGWLGIGPPVVVGVGSFGFPGLNISYLRCGCELRRGDLLDKPADDSFPAVSGEKDDALRR